MADAAEIAALLRSEIADALEEMDPMARQRRMREAARDGFLIAYNDLTPGTSTDVTAGHADDFVGSLQNMFSLTDPDGSPEQVDRIAGIMGVAAMNAATLSANPGLDKTWRTMLDDRVRDLHVPMEGVTVGSLDTFDVDGFQLQYPGQPIGPPEVWINCRCHLAMGATLTSGGDMDPSDSVSSALETGAHVHSFNSNPLSHSHPISVDPDVIVARSFDAEKRRQMADRGTAMPDGSFPIANVEDLRNAIQAIGRAKDPDAARRHIRKRAKALGAENLLPDSWTASAEADEAITAAPGTRDGPGWLTNPRDTQRLRDYWTRGAGAGKIRWGTSGDFDRCRKQLAKYVSNPSYLAGTCANLHFVALGYWPGDLGKPGNPPATPENRRRAAYHARRSDGAPDFDPDFDTEETAAVTAAFTAATDLTDELPPVEWFQDPGLEAVTPLTVTDDGRVMGHLAPWGTCHVGVSGACTQAPHSNHDYAYFRTGEAVTSAGPVPVGQITMDTGHAGTDLGPTAAVAHYDDTGTVVADVAAGEDDFGIWVAGMVRPGTTEAQLRTLRAGALSGDWRRIGGNLELVAALVVNVPGFPIPRAQVASVNGQEYALTAAAVVTVDPNAVDADRVAIAVMAAMDQRDADTKRRQRAAALAGQITELRVGALTAAGE